MRPLVCLLIAVTAASAGAQSRRVTFGPGVCGPIDPAYVSSANETGGQVFPLGADEIAAKGARTMESGFLRDTVLWAHGNGERSFVVPIDRSIGRVMFSATFDTSGGSVTLIAPDGMPAQEGTGVEDTQLHCGRIVSVDAPTAGMWQVRVAPSGRFWLVVNAKTNLPFGGAEFVERDRAEPERLVRRQDDPAVGEETTLRVWTPSDIIAPAFQLVMMDGTPLRDVDLQRADDGAFAGTVVMPAMPFRVMMTGRDTSGFEVQRITRRLFRARAAAR